MTDGPPSGKRPAQPAGYSGTPQLKKLGIATGIRVAVVRKPRGWSFAEPLPRGCAVRSTEIGTPVGIVLAFVREPDGFADLPEWGERIFPDGAVWIAWPRKAAGHVSDVNENMIRDEALPLGLVDVKVAAIDDDWSGLKLVWRKELRTRSHG